MDDMLSKTDASETVLRFVAIWDERHSSTTTTFENCTGCSAGFHWLPLATVFDDRVNFIRTKKAQIQQEIDDLHAGGGYSSMKRSNENGFGNLSTGFYLTGDFRRWKMKFVS